MTTTPAAQALDQLCNELRMSPADDAWISELYEIVSLALTSQATPAAQALITAVRDLDLYNGSSGSVRQQDRLDELCDALELVLTSRASSDATATNVAAGGEAVESFRNLEDDSTFGEYRDQLAVGNLTAVDQIAFDNLLHKLTEHPKGYFFIKPEDRAPEREHNGRGGDEGHSPGPRKLYAARPAPAATQPEPAPSFDGGMPVGGTSRGPAPVVEAETARFGHHPSPAIDFEIEVEALRARLFDAEHGISKPGTPPEHIGAVRIDIDRAMGFRVGGDIGAVRAKHILRILAAPNTERAGVRDDTHAFKNFHRSLCARFGYTHDEIDWRRDLVSLEEHIAMLTSAPRAGVVVLPKVVAYEYLHDVTGRTALVEAHQVECGWEKNNPQYSQCGAYLGRAAVIKALQVAALRHDGSET